MFRAWLAERGAARWPLLERDGLIRTLKVEASEMGTPSVRGLPSTAWQNPEGRGRGRDAARTSCVWESSVLGVSSVSLRGGARCVRAMMFADNRWFGRGGLVTERHPCRAP